MHRHRLSRRLMTVLAALLLGVLTTACGSDDGAEVRNLDSEADGSASGSGSGSGSASGSGSGSGSATAVSDAECSPVNPELESDADTTVDVTARDYAFDPAEIEVEAGVVTFTVANEGEEPHELAFLPGGGEVPFTDEGVPDEEALAEAGAFELEAFGTGQTCNATYDLEPGEYTLFCIVATPEGSTHYEEGMAGTLSVS